MLTQCPECETTFRISTAILRAANGQVRCGRCRTQFDALDRLLDDEGLPLSRIDQTTLTDEPPPARDIIVEEPPAQEDITLEGRRAEVTGSYRVLSDEGAGVEDSGVVQGSYVIESEAPDESDELLTSDERELAPEADARVPTHEEDVLPDSASTPTEAAEDKSHQAASRPASDPSAEIDLLAKPERPRSSLIWKLAVVPLVLLLIAQYVHHERADLARHPTLGPPVLSLYSALGLAIDPNWNVREYDLKQRGVIADPATPGTLTVRATITNLSRYPQPFPLLKLVLEDRWGNPVRSRAFRPDEYSVIADAEKLMAPGQRTDARIAIADPGKEAEGFRFDLCLPRTQGMICADDVPSSH